MDGYLTIGGAFDHYPHVTECLQGGQGVFPFQEAFHLGHTIRQGAQHDGTVGHGFVARHANAAIKLATRGHQIGRVGLACVCHDCVVT